MIIRLSTMSEEKKKLWAIAWHHICLSGSLGIKILEPSLDFNEHGLRFPLDYLQTVGRAIILFPLEYMAEYADQVTCAAVDCGDDKYLGIPEEITDDELQNNINATTIGNLAYILLHSKDEMQKERCEKILNHIHEAQTKYMLELLKKSDLWK